MSDPTLVTRQLGLSSASRHLGFPCAIRGVVDAANLLRTHAFGLLAAYYDAVAMDPLGATGVVAPCDAFSDLIFQLLTDPVGCVDRRLTATAERYRDMLAAEGIALNRTGSVARICQSFRSNIVTNLNNFFNKPYSLQKSYMMAKYSLKASEAKALCARLGRSQAEVLMDARSAYGKRCCAAEHEALEALSAAETPASLQKYATTLAAKEAASSLPEDSPLIWHAFDVRFPLPELDEGIDARAIWETERSLLPATDDFSGLFANYARMAAACRDAVAAGTKCKVFALCPTTGFSVDFVPMDKATVLMMLREFRQGNHGASADLKAFLRTHLRDNDDWGLYVLFNERKLKKLFTAKHVIDGQLLTDGVRVIFPLRTHAASAIKAAAGKASGEARSAAGMMSTVEQFLSLDEATMYSAGTEFLKAFGKKRKFKEEAGIIKENVKDLKDQAQAAKNAAAKAAALAAAKLAANEKKRKRDQMTKEELDAERASKVASKRKKKEDPYAHIKSVPDDWYVTGIDVGHCNPVFAARKRVGSADDERPQFYKVTLGQWYTMTGQRSRARLLNQKVKRAKLPPLPTVATSGDDLWNALAFRARHHGRFYGLYGCVALRRAAFDCYMKKQKALRAVGRALVPDEKTVLAWGDGDFAHTRRGLATSVSGTIARFIKHNHADRIRITPEHRTSMLCSCCMTKMKHVVDGHVMRKNGQPFRVRRQPDGNLIPREIHGLYQCSKEGCYIRWDRDKNAAINIRNVFLSICTTRLPPLHYQRGFKMG
jgi:hypothetical protein